MAEKSKSSRIYAFVEAKTDELQTDSPYARAALARLRRGVGEEIGDCPDVWDVLLEELDDDLMNRRNAPSRAEIAIFTALTLFAVHQQGKYPDKMSRGKSSFGAAVKKLIDPDHNNEKAIKRRFDAVITAKDYKELSHHARGLIQLLKSKDIPLSYPQFAKDVYLFQIPEIKNDVKLRWGEDYYRKSKEEGKKEEKTTNE